MSSADVANSINAPVAPKSRKLRLRVYIVLSGLFLLGVFSTLSEGVEGVLTFLQGVGMLLVLWMTVWHLFLKDVQIFQTLVSVLLVGMTREEDAAPHPKRAVQFQ